ncbi:FAD-binding domain-containing protein [Xylariaceae sp. FL1272]|nr:FAD-binding domain-containing protein [Xylariaceae sp. FL1272]
MSPRTFIGSTLILAVAVALAYRYEGTISDNVRVCRTTPGDASWPTSATWAELNTTLGGKLIANTPLSAPCHETLFGRANAFYNADECTALRNRWFYPETHIPSSSSPMAYPFSNNSCNPFLSPDTPCTIGSHPIYTVNATETADFQAAVRFATDHNIRLVIRNTGHDYLGKSTGAHSLSVWTRNFKSMAVVAYESQAYTGPALKVGAGVEVIEAYRYVSPRGLAVVGGNCPTVALAGGYTQGGGHGHFASTHGLAADQVLEWEVVTGTGELLIVSETQNSDLFWALRGGGGGTFGIVSSLTVKAFPETLTSTASLSVLNNGANTDSIYAALVPFIRDTLPALVDAGAYVVWILAPFGFMISPATAPGVAQAQLDSLLKPLLTNLNALSLQHEYASAQYPTFLQTYTAQQTTLSWNVSDYNVAGRLIPREAALRNTEALVDALRYISSQTLLSGVSWNLTRGGVSGDAVSVNPVIRSSLFSVTVGTPINYTDWSLNKGAQDKLTYDFLPALESVAPDGGAYLNEADFQQPDFEKVIYGRNYGKLVRIKNKYDPFGVFYARTGVGSDQWAEDLSGRLCKVKK